MKVIPQRKVKYFKKKYNDPSIAIWFSLSDG